MDFLTGGENAVGDLVAAGDATENVAKHNLHVLVLQDDPQGGRDGIGPGASANVKKVGGADSAGFAIQQGHVHRSHGQTGAIHHAPDLPVQADVTYAGLPGHFFRRGQFGRIMQRCQLWLPGQGIVIDHHFAVQRQQGIVFGDDQRVDFGQLGIALFKTPHQRRHDLAECTPVFSRQIHGAGELDCLEREQAGDGVHVFPNNCLRPQAVDLFNLDTAFSRSHQDRFALRAVIGDSQIDFLGNAGCRINQDRPDPVSLDVHSQDCTGVFTCFLRRVCQPYAAGLATPTHQHLRLDRDRATGLLRQREGFFGAMGHRSLRHRNAEFRKAGLGLIFVEIQDPSS